MKARTIAACLVVLAGMQACAALIGVDKDYREHTGDGGSVTGDERTGSLDGDVDAPCSTDLAHDSENCGACGHKCTKGSCEDGACVAVEEVTATAGDPTAIAVDGTRVVWIDRGGGGVGAGALETCEKGTTCTPRTIAALTAPSAMVLVGGSPIVAGRPADGMGMPRILGVSNVDGGQATVDCYPSSPADNLHGLAAGADRAWAIRDKEVVECPAACSPAAKCVKIGASEMSYMIGTDGASLAWFQKGGLFGCTPGACMAKLLTADVSPPSAIAMRPSRVYFASGGDLFLWDTTATRRVSSLTGSTSFMTTDGDDVLVATSDGVSRIRSGAGPAVALVSGVDVVAVAADATHIYFTERKGRVLRHKK